MSKFIDILFKKNSSPKRTLPRVETLKVVVVSFLEYGNHNFGHAFFRLLQKNPNFNVSYFDEEFDKSFLNLQGKNFFDMADTGNMILQKLNADVVIWGFQDNENIRLNFQTGNAYSDWDNVSYSILESFYIPAEQLEHINFFSENLYNLIIGGIAAAISEQRVDLKYLKQKILKSVIHKLIDARFENGPNFMLSPTILNIIGLIYLSYQQQELSLKTFSVIKELYNNALLYKNQIMQNVHLGLIYKNLGQLYETALKQDLDGHWVLFREAINNYRIAQKYLDHYNCPYDFALISFKLSQLYFQYWKLCNDIQALRTAISYLREAEKTYTKLSFPELWSKIEGNLGFYLSLLGSFSKSNDISKLAIKSYQNKQQVYRKELYPIIWAKIQEDIANIYYNMAKNEHDKMAFVEALDYFQSALKVYEAKKMLKEITIVHNSIDKVIKSWRG